MPRHNLNKASKSPFLKISFLFICLFLSQLSFAENEKESQVLKESKPDLVEIRLNSIEKELQDHKTKMAVLEATRLNSVEEELKSQKKRLSILESKQDSQFHEFHDDISILERKLINNKHKREVSSSLAVKKEPSTKHCADSSRLCTFFYPDHVDAIIKKNKDTSSHTKIMQEVFNSKAVVATSLDHPPTSCKELKQIGHTLNGFYLVQDILEHSKKILTVYCNFTEETNSLEKFIGRVDLKTKTIHFYVQKETNMMENGIISFEVERLNVGGAMNPASGVFTAPVNGIYHFDFSVIKDGASDYLVVELQVNSIGYGRAHTSARTSNTVASLTASLRLKVGDRVVLNNIAGGKIFDNAFHHAHFAGWLVDEELAL